MAWEVSELTKSRRVHWTKRKKRELRRDSRQKKKGRHVRDKKENPMHTRSQGTKELPVKLKCK